MSCNRYTAGLLASFMLGLFAGCAGSESKDGDPEAKIRSVSLESLTPYKQVFLKVGPDTLKNCDTASDYKVFVKVPPKAGAAKTYDAFAVNGDPILSQTFLRAENDSIYFMATVQKQDKADVYVSLCLERRYIAETLVTLTPGAKNEGRKGKGPHGGGGRRRSGGFG